MSTTIELTEASIQSFEKDGAILIKGLFRDWIEQIAQGIEHNMREPGIYASENLKDNEKGRFFDDYCNWQRIPDFEAVIKNSELGAISAQLMRSETVQVFHDHVLVKEPGTAKPTPWHQDSPYYFVEGEQTVSFWCPIDTVTDATLRCVAGSQNWPKMVLPVRWLSNDDFYPDQENYIPVPDPDADPENYRVVEWQMEPGDAVAFHYRTLHGARGNTSTSRRRAFSVRVVGDDARFVNRPGPTSPPFPGHQMHEGDKLREDWFPVIYPEGSNN